MDLFKAHFKFLRKKKKLKVPRGRNFYFVGLYGTVSNIQLDADDKS